MLPPIHSVAFGRASGLQGLDVCQGGTRAGFIVGRGVLWLHVIPTAGEPRCFYRLSSHPAGWRSRMAYARAIMEVLLERLRPDELLAALDTDTGLDALALARGFGFEQRTEG